MSFYVYCNNTSDLSIIQAYFENLIDFKTKYEVAVVEIGFNICWESYFGNFSIYLNKELISSFSLSDYDHSPIENYISNILDEIRSLKLLVKIPSIHYNPSKKLLSFAVRDNDMEFETDFFGKTDRFSHLDIYNFSRHVRKSNFLSIYCDFISDQIFGLEKLKLLKIVPVRGSALDWEHHSFDSPHYVDVGRTCINNINLVIKDEHNQIINFLKHIYIKLHFRPKTK